MISLNVLSQESKKINRLNKEIKTLEVRIERLKERIIEIGKVENRSLALYKNIKYPLILLDLNDSITPLDTIYSGERAKVLIRGKRVYKIQNEDKVGFVDASFFRKAKPIKVKSSYTRKKRSIDYSRPIKVRGHYRTTKSGKRVYVRPHTRKRRDGK